MPDEAIGCVAGLFRTTGGFIIEFFFEIICGYVGHYTVRLITFGKTHLEPDSFSAIASGFITILCICLLIWYIVFP